MRHLWQVNIVYLTPVISHIQHNNIARCQSLAKCGVLSTMSLWAASSTSLLFSPRAGERERERVTPLWEYLKCLAQRAAAPPYLLRQIPPPDLITFNHSSV